QRIRITVAIETPIGQLRERLACLPRVDSETDGVEPPRRLEVGIEGRLPILFLSGLATLRESGQRLRQRRIVAREQTRPQTKFTLHLRRVVRSDAHGMQLTCERAREQDNRAEALDGRGRLGAGALIQETDERQAPLVDLHLQRPGRRCRDPHRDLAPSIYRQTPLAYE